MSFLIANVRGIHPTQLLPDKPRLWVQYMLSSGANIAILTETHTTAHDNPLATHRGAIFAHSSRKRKGICTPRSPRCVSNPHQGLPRPSPGSTGATAMSTPYCDRSSLCPESPGQATPIFREGVR